MSKLQHLSGKGDILEFGVCSGVSTCEIAQAATQRRVIGFDHFQGLEQTKKLASVSGIFTMSPQDHNGLDLSAFEMVRIVNGDWSLVK